MRRPQLALGLSALLLPALAAHADDWRMLRQDVTRAGASQDRIRFPLAEIWDAPSATDLPSRAEVLVWKGRAYFHRRELAQTVVSCVDARTGVELWFRPGQNEAAVSDAGILFTNVPNSAYRSVAATPGGPVTVPGSSTAAVAYDAATGLLLASQPLVRAPTPRLGTREGLFRREDAVRLLLTDGPIPGNPLEEWGPVRIKDTIGSIGSLLPVGGQLFGLSFGDQAFRWAPGNPAFWINVAHTPRFLLPGSDLTPAGFFDTPLALSDGGVVVHSERDSGSIRAPRWLGVLDGMSQLRWHRDFDWGLGAPAVDGGRIFAVVDGTRHQGVIALDAGNGEPRWVFAPNGLAIETNGSLTVHGMRGSGQLPTASSPRGAQAPRVARPPTNTYSPLRNPQAPPGTPGAPQAPIFVPRNQTLPGGSAPAPGGLPVRPQGTVSPGIPSASVPPMYSGTVPIATVLLSSRKHRLIVKDGRVYGRVEGAIVALDGETGRLIWMRPVPPDVAVSPQLATRDALLVHAQKGKVRALFALRLSDGKTMAVDTRASGAQLSIGRGLLFEHYGLGAKAFAPAERTFTLAVDSDATSDYLKPPPEEPKTEPKEEAPAGGADDGKKDVEPEPRPTEPAKPEDVPLHLQPLNPLVVLQPAPLPGGIADATVLRLSFADPVEENLRKAKARRTAAGAVPMLLSLDWLDARRARAVGPLGPGGELPDTQRFAELCARLAGAVHPEHFDVAPEVNVLLARTPQLQGAVAALVRAARQAVREVSPETRVLVSFNREVLGGRYGHGRYRPFGDLEQPKLADAARPAALIDLVDEMGLTSYPQAGYSQWTEIPGDYFLSIKERLGDKPLVIAGLGAGCNETLPNGAAHQASYVKRLLQLCYWIDAPLVAYPEVTRPQETGRPAREYDPALRLGADPRPALAAWWDVLGWRRVERLSAAQEGGGPEKNGEEEKPPAP